MAQAAERHAREVEREGVQLALVGAASTEGRDDNGELLGAREHLFVGGRDEPEAHERTVAPVAPDLDRCVEDPYGARVEHPVRESDIQQCPTVTTQILDGVLDDLDGKGRAGTGRLD